MVTRKVIAITCFALVDPPAAHNVEATMTNVFGLLGLHVQKPEHIIVKANTGTIEFPDMEAIRDFDWGNHKFHISLGDDDDGEDDQEN